MENVQIVSNNILDEQLNEVELEDEFFDSVEEDDDADEEVNEPSVVDNQPEVVDEENHWLLRGVKRIRRSIDQFFSNTPNSKVDDVAEDHLTKVHKRTGKGGKKGKKSRANEEHVARKTKNEEKRKERQERRKEKLEKRKQKQVKRKERQEKRLAAQQHKEHKPALRVRRQHLSLDDEDFVDGSGSNSLDVTNRQCGCEYN